MTCTDVDDLRRTITDAALLVAAAVVYAGSPRMEVDTEDSVDIAASLLALVRESIR